MEVKNRLLNFNKAIIYQNDDWFKFSLDSVLLSNFVTINLSAKKIIDLATGNAPIPMLLSYRTNAKIYGVELQKEIFLLGKKSIIENKMNNQIELINYDVNDILTMFNFESFDIVTCNPPYFRESSKRIYNSNQIKAIARHEINLKLQEVINIASKLLKNKGIFALVHRPERFIEIIELMKKNNIEPKRVRFVYSKYGKESNILLIEGMKNGKSGLKVLPPLYIYNEDGNYTEEMEKMFGE